MKLRIAGEHPRRPPQRQRRQQATYELMGVGRKGERCFVRKIQDAGDAAPNPRHQLLKDGTPFGVSQARRLPHGLIMGPACGVGPVMMAVRGKVYASWRSVSEDREVLPKVEGHC